MRGKQFFAMGMALICILGGCGTVGGAEGVSQESGAQFGQPIPGGAEPEQPPTAAVELSEEEKAFFTAYVRESENYGFLLSEYDAPEDVNLWEVLYNGAGFGEWIPEEDIPLYLAKTQLEGVETDCVKMTRQSIEEFLQRKLGVGLEDMSSPLEMVYLEETDAYYNQAGDTNYVPFACVGGTRQGDTYTLYCDPTDDWYTGYGACETVLVKTGDDYRFVSNHALAEQAPEGAASGDEMNPTEPETAKTVEGYALVDGKAVSVKVTIGVESVLRGEEAYNKLREQNADLEKPGENEEYIIIHLNVFYDEGEPEELFMFENRASLQEASLYFSLSNCESNTFDATSYLSESIYNVSVLKGQSAQGAVAFLQEKDNVNPLYFIGFGDCVELEVNK